MRRFHPAALVVLAAVVTIGCPRPPDEIAVAAPRPNVLLVVLDTTRADSLSCYGHPQATTPAIDAVATQGTLYRNAYATSFWTLPSHASILTGLYPTEAGATSETNHLPEQAVTLAEQLASAGYRTGAVIRNAWITTERGFSQGFGDFIEAWRGEGDRPDIEGETAAVDSATEWIDARVVGDSQPFFLFVNLNIAHLPYTPPEEVWHRFAPATAPSERVEFLRSISGGWGHLAGKLHLDETDLEILRSLYVGEVAVADSLVARLIDSLDSHDILDDTLVIITSDHGENLGEHGLIDHVLSMYDTTVRVPLVIRYPGRFAPGSVVDDLASLVDLTPTILEICGATDPSIVSRSLGAPTANLRHAVYAENGRPVNGLRALRRHFPNFDTASVDHPLRMLRLGRDKLIWKVGASAELYDIETDPSELVDRSSAETDIRNRLLDDLRGWATGMTGPTATRSFTSRDAESLKRLRALGYVE